MASTRYTYFTLWTEPTPELGDLLRSIGKCVEEHIHPEKGPYYYVYMGKQMSESRLAKLTGVETVEGVPVIPAKEVELARSAIEMAKRENDALVKKGKMILEILLEDNTPEDILLPAERRAVKAYKKLLERDEERLRKRIANTLSVFADETEDQMI